MKTEETTGQCDIRLKIVFLGDIGVGKTSIIQRFVKDSFDPENYSTIGIDFLSKNIPYNNKLYRLQLWDTAGQEKYKSLVPAYLRDADCAVFVADVTRKQTLDNLHLWLQLFRDHQSPKAIGLLVLNKIDMEEERNLTTLTIQQYIKKQSLEYRQVSAKVGKGVKEMFQSILEMLGSRGLEDQQERQMSENFLIKFKRLKDESNGRMGCCYI